MKIKFKTMFNKKIKCKYVFLVKTFIILFFLSGYSMQANDVSENPPLRILKNIGFQDVKYVTHDSIVDNTENKTDLLEIVINGTNSMMRYFAAKKINDQSLFGAIAKNEKEDYGLRVNIMQLITSQAVIANIALNDSDRLVRTSAIQKLNDLTLLGKIEKNTNEHHLVRYEAAKRPNWMRDYERKNLDDYASFSALTQTNDIPPLSEAAFYYLNGQIPALILDDNDKQITDHDETPAMIDKNQTNKIDVEIVLENSATKRNMANIHQHSAIKLNVNKIKLFFVALGLGSIFIIPFFFRRDDKNLSSHSTKRKLHQ